MILIVLPDIAAEDRLLAQARQGNQDAVMHIYDSYFPPIYNFIRLRVDDRAAAEDLASEVFVAFVTAIQNRKGPRNSLRGWLFRVARNLLHDHYNALTTTALEEWMPASADNDPEGKALLALDVDRARRAMRMLAEDQQQVLVLRFWQGLSLEETADVMGRGVGAVKSLQFRAVNTMRQFLDQV
jgi:RNA polymerase sigma-70 factor (ECF subfamily)